MRVKLAIAALVASVATATPAFAQAVSASAQAEARGIIVQPLTLASTSDLDFGTVVASAVAGDVTIDADDGSRTTTGGVLGVVSYPGSRGEFQGAGTEGQLVELTLSAPAFLVSTSNPLDLIVVSDFVLDNGNLTTRTIGAGGTFTVGVGGTFDIAAGQPSGLYSADFDLTAEYQ